jgi:hypothetical protein
MAAIKFSLANIAHFYSAISPFVICGFTLFNSFMNYDIKGLIYLVGLLFSQLPLIIFKGMAGGQKEVDKKHADPRTRGDYCDIIESPMPESLKYVSWPSNRAWFHGFTALYFLMGVIYNKYNDGLVFTLAIMAYGIMDMVFRVINGCESKGASGIGKMLFSWILAGVFGVIWFLIMYFIPTKESLTYFGKEKPKRCSLSNVNYSCSFKK